MITIKHLSKTFINPDGSSLTVLKDVNCTIDKGEVISIIGPSGTGKSTLLRAINMLEPPTSGEIIVNGETSPRPAIRWTGCAVIWAWSSSPSTSSST